MSKLLSKEQIDSIAKDWWNSLSLPHQASITAYGATRDSFQAAFTLLMPIIEKQMEALEAEWPGEYGAIIREHHDEFIQEAKQMLEKLGEEVK